MHDKYRNTVECVQNRYYLTKCSLLLHPFCTCATRKELTQDYLMPHKHMRLLTHLNARMHNICNCYLQQACSLYAAAVYKPCTHSTYVHVFCPHALGICDDAGPILCK